MNISVLMPHWRKLEFLPRTLPPLLAQLEEDDEILVMCDGDYNEVLLYMEENHPAELRDKVIKVAGYCLKPEGAYRISNLMNQGFSIAKNEMVVTLAPDCLVQENWRRNLVMHIGRGKLVIGRVDIEGLDKGVLQDVRIMAMYAPQVNIAELCWGANMAVSKQDFYAVGGYDESFDGGWGCEDSMMGAKMIAMGLEYVFVIDAPVLHCYHPKTFFGDSADNGILYRNRMMYYEFLWSNWDKLRGRQVKVVSSFDYEETDQ